MLTKSYAAAVKAAGPDDGMAEGEYKALVSVFGNIDSYGDKVMPGAFTDTLQEWQAKGDPIPVYYSHRLDDPDFNIGEVLAAQETDAGLEVHARLDLDNPKARQVYRLLKGKRLTQHSFTYDVIDGGPASSGDYNELRKLRLWEVGPTPIGANSATELLAVKAARKAIEDAEEAAAAGQPCPTCGLTPAEHETPTEADTGDEDDDATPETVATTQVTMHPESTQDGGEKSHAKAGRVLSAKNEQKLRDALSAIEDVLAALSTDSGQADETKATTNRPAKAEEPHGAKAEEPSGCSPARVRLSAEFDLLGLD